MIPQFIISAVSETKKAIFTVSDERSVAKRTFVIANGMYVYLIRLIYVTPSARIASVSVKTETSASGTADAAVKRSAPAKSADISAQNDSLLISPVFLTPQYWLARTTSASAQPTTIC